ncbi:PREDICTED: uncharacterized protein LOC108792443 [Nanorana parkeri]|uniref:uncharacterized protein LOC108792443 n=1 Tax=Nanorana parkeri TaxID=125878 RepID=UPI000854FFE1|nr:PREDICTED: uncharacterized protein LOC108792443 [Nanorana parkeri]
MTSPGSSLVVKMEELGQQPDNKNTLKKTKFDLRIVQAYLQRAREERPMLSIPVEELDAHLANFIHTHRKQDGSEYEPGTLRGILGSLDRHFERCGYPHAIYRSRDTKFLRTVAAMKEKQNYLKTVGKGSHPQHAEPLTEREIELLYATGAIGLHNPTALLYMLFFNIGLHFSLRTMEQHNLKWGDIHLKADAQGRKYLEHTKKLSPGRGGGGGARFHPSHTMRMQIYESPEQPDRDVVKAYEKYSVERPEKMKCEDAPFYLTPQPDCRPGYARWFKNLPVGESRIRGIMKHLKMAAGLPPQRKILGRSPLRSPVPLGSSMASILSAQVKALRGEPSLNGCRSNGVTIKKEEDDSYGQEDSSNTGGRYKALGIRGFGTRLSESSRALPSAIISNPKLTRIKEEWEPEEVSSPGVVMGEKSDFPGQGSVTFHDVAACFTTEEWAELEDWQKKLYKNVMQEIHSALEAMGYKILNADVLLKIKDGECDKKSPAHEKKDSATASGRGVSPDILLRINQDAVPDWREMEEAEKEDELDTSNSIPVFDPDLSMWIFKESPDISLPEDGRDQLLHADTDEGVSIPHSAPSSFKGPLPEISTLCRPICPELPRPGKRKRHEGVSIPHSAPSSFKGPLPEISTLCRPICPELPRPGKRKRRPPQRRTSEQQPDSDSDEEEPNHRLPCRNPPSLGVTGERKDWTAQDRLYQCDLCERTFSDLCNLQETILSCPQCGGSLNPLPNQPADTGHTQTLNFSEPGSDTGLPRPLQGPVG